jgi:hypothetical protein
MPDQNVEKDYNFEKVFLFPFRVLSRIDEMIVDRANYTKIRNYLRIDYNQGMKAVPPNVFKKYIIWRQKLLAPSIDYHFLKSIKITPTTFEEEHK